MLIRRLYGGTFAMSAPSKKICPEDVMIVGEDVGMLTGVVESVLFKGVHYEMIIDTGAMRWKVHSTQMQPVGSRVGLTIVPFNIHIMRKPAPIEEA